jgi:hypothetical protein
MREDDRIVSTIGELDPIEQNAPRRLARRVVMLSLDPTSDMLGIGAAPMSDDPDDGGIIVAQGPAMAVPEPEAKSAAPKAAASPKPAVPRKEAWKLGGGRYILQSGDTFFGLAVTYLGSGPRWRELRAFQPDAWRTRNPDPNLIRAGDVILMPKEAQDRARQLGVLANVAGFSPGKVAAAALTTVVAGVVSYFAGSNS